MAVINGQTEIVKEILGSCATSSLVDLEQVVLPETKQTLLSLLLLHCPGIRPRIVLSRSSVTPIAVSAVDSEGNTVLMALAARDSRETVRRLLISQAAAEIHAFDLSAKNIQGKNLLHLLVQKDDK